MITDYNAGHKTMGHFSNNYKFKVTKCPFNSSMPLKLNLLLLMKTLSTHPLLPPNKDEKLSLYSILKLF